MKNIVVLCTGNSCRSQMLDGFLSKKLAGIANIYSAGIEVHGLNPRAVKVMSEAGIDISGNTSNHIDEYTNIEFDTIITVCDHALENCPWFPSNAKRQHHSFPDPAKATGNEEDVLNQFRAVRDEIESFASAFSVGVLNE